MSLEDIIGRDYVDKYYTFNDIYLHREWIWFETGVSAVSVITGELLYIKNFSKKNHKYMDGIDYWLFKFYKNGELIQTRNVRTYEQYNRILENNNSYEIIIELKYNKNE